MIAGAAIATHAIAMPGGAFVPFEEPEVLSPPGLDFTLPDRRLQFALPVRQLHFTLVPDNA